MAVKANKSTSSGKQVNFLAFFFFFCEVIFLRVVRYKAIIPALIHHNAIC